MMILSSVPYTLPRRASIQRLVCLLATIVLFTAVSCRSARQAVVADTPVARNTPLTTPDRPLAAIAKASKPWQTVKAGGNLRLASGSKSFSSSVQVRMERGRAVSISLRPLLGIEVGRLIVFGDSIVLMDKVHKKYFAEKASVLTAGMPIGVADVQDILLGRAFELGGQSLTAANADRFSVRFNADSLVVLTPKEQPEQFTYDFVVSRQSVLRQLEVSPTIAKHADTTYGVVYTDVQASPAGPVAGGVGIVTEIQGKPASVSVTYNKYQWNEEVDISTDVPQNYQRIAAKDLLNLFSSF